MKRWPAQPEASLLQSLFYSCPTRNTDGRKRLPVFSFRKLVSALRAWLATVD
ncbi:hypothetical protein BU25DRAFT_409673 [Macroventuria anomochaeta]|uniref:Uncharacterized protein n=1 Tax=Macroventuria anomochaeta TaxID=301207 RepID=A0ACB6S3M4_9PLEO|nr:uncharacterized protein BU25DRAFT_409673 [Macroventuria anomochaeta]KAF2628639.1 hypothetical protein BU25DRAFT_409673 [Macroventuria anomochaeta]